MFRNISGSSSALTPNHKLDKILDAAVALLRAAGTGYRTVHATERVTSRSRASSVDEPILWRAMVVI
jgi:hypothetical protein